MRLRGSPFPIGTIIHNRTILAIIRPTQQLSFTVYLVLAHACNHEYEIKHKALLDKRMDDSPGYCSNCAHKRGGRKQSQAERATQEKAHGRPPKPAHPERTITLWAHSLWPLPNHPNRTLRD